MKLSIALIMMWLGAVLTGEAQAQDRCTVSSQLKVGSTLSTGMGHSSCVGEKGYYENYRLVVTKAQRIRVQLQTLTPPMEIVVIEADGSIAGGATVYANAKQFDDVTAYLEPGTHRVQVRTLTRQPGSYTLYVRNADGPNYRSAGSCFTQDATKVDAFGTSYIVLSADCKLERGQPGLIKRFTLPQKSVVTMEARAATGNTPLIRFLGDGRMTARERDAQRPAADLPAIIRDTLEAGTYYVVFATEDRPRKTLTFEVNATPLKTEARRDDAAVLTGARRAEALRLHNEAEAATRRRDYAAALAPARRAAELGYAPAQYRLAWLYNHGYGVRRDEFEALKWYKRAAAQDYANAHAALGMLFSASHLNVSGTGRANPEVDCARALRHFTFAINKKVAAAASNLALLYRHGSKGHCFPRNDSEAVHYARIAYQLDRAMVQGLGTMYAAARSVERDAKLHLAADRQAAAQDDRLAQFMMGRRYEMGWSVPRNLQEAIRYYRMGKNWSWNYNSAALKRLGIN